MLTKLRDNPKQSFLTRFKNFKICIINFLQTLLLHLIAKCFTRKKLFRKAITVTSTEFHHSARSASKKFAFVEEANSKSYGIDSIRYQTIIIWNKLQNNIISDLTKLSRMKVKSTIIEDFSKSYKIQMNPKKMKNPLGPKRAYWK